MRELFKKFVPGSQFSAEEENRLRDTVASHDRPTGIDGLVRGPRIIQSLGGIQVYDDTYRPFWAQITGSVVDGNGRTAYTWQEQRQDDPGVPTDHTDGRNDNSSSILAYEWSGADVPEGAFVQLWIGYDSQTYYVFSYKPLVVQDTRYSTRLTQPVGANDTQIAVESAALFPTANNYYGVMGKEIVLVTGGAGSQLLTVTRAQLNTSAAEHESWSQFRQLFPPIQVKLVNDIGPDDEELEVDGLGNLPSYGKFFINIDNEAMIVSTGAGTTTYTVKRAFQSQKAAHKAGTIVYQIMPDVIAAVKRIKFEGNAFVQPGSDDGVSVAVHYEVCQFGRIPQGATPDADGDYYSYLQRFDDPNNDFVDDIPILIQDVNAKP